VGLIISMQLNPPITKRTNMIMAHMLMTTAHMLMTTAHMLMTTAQMLTTMTHMLTTTARMLTNMPMPVVLMALTQLAHLRPVGATRLQKGPAMFGIASTKWIAPQRNA